MKIEIDRLNQEIEELKAENAELKLRLELSQPLYSRRKLEAENARYREALEFYADITNWSHLKGFQADENPWGRPIIKFDDLYPVEPCSEWGTYGGRRAREALKGGK